MRNRGRLHKADKTGGSFYAGSARDRLEEGLVDHKCNITTAEITTADIATLDIATVELADRRACSTGRVST
jgi:hypothetical protein